jgi:general secretion pathway protein G
MKTVKKEQGPTANLPFTVQRSPFTVESRGFTLIELVVVIAVLGLLAGLVGPQVFRHLSGAKTTTARTQIDMLGVALDGYRLDNGSYPTTEQGLAALRERPAREPLPSDWRGPYLRKELPVDPWGRPYIYRVESSPTATGYELQTLGRDGKPGGEGEDKDLSGS